METGLVEKFVETKDFNTDLTFDKRKNLSSMEQLILFNHKIKEKQSSPHRDPASEYKVRRSLQMKEQAQLLREMRELAEQER